ncbi:hypothetical protein DFN06_002512 [Clostridium beijerinckii]|nr:multidrug efflux MFS transporter [Clostridium beijerinckii]NRZ26796.1 hypothetical protein [Clostridium beijerinckii]
MKQIFLYYIDENLANGITGWLNEKFGRKNLY